MHNLIEEELKEACDYNDLSDETYLAMKTILARKLNGEISPADLPADIKRLFALIKEDTDET